MFPLSWVPSIIPKYSGVGEFCTQLPFAAVHFEAVGAPDPEPTTPLFTELIETSDPFPNRAMFLASFEKP